ncbi:uncharacterized protein LOC115352429 [Aquila chrysaetos chrysaetos]|uniref:uncharacterized protein LOC115352429 n=1 Tax=Aquila chrysaetos chrysaetos TaxID=223781 RepID=UPI0011766288|nr:uncharacterized protein LOC115352429 [Aquila chrysaetos chrysaetos]
MQRSCYARRDAKYQLAGDTTRAAAGDAHPAGASPGTSTDRRGAAQTPATAQRRRGRKTCVGSRLSNKSWATLINLSKRAIPVQRLVLINKRTSRRCKDHIANSGYTLGSFMQRTGMLFWSGALLFGSLKPLDVKIIGIARGPSLCQLSIISTIFLTSHALPGESHCLLTDGCKFSPCSQETIIKAGEEKVPMEC